MNTLADNPLTNAQLDRIGQLHKEHTQPFYVLSLVAEVRRQRDTIDKIRNLHKPEPVYRSVGDCLTPDQHEHSYDPETDWWFCGQCPPWGHVCTTCRDGNGLHEVTWPCLDARALGVTE